ncbi:unnamed protein product, partial [marine sediment metagenome]
AFRMKTLIRKSYRGGVPNGRTRAETETNSPEAP